jgi:hypothetical protein
VTSNGQRPIDGIPDGWLQCRDLGHSFAPHQVKVSRKRGEIHRILKCRNCPTLRVQVLTLDGYRVRSRYEYPEQQDSEATPYVLKGVGHLSVDDNAAIRVASTQHMRSTKGDWS